MDISNNTVCTVSVSVFVCDYCSTDKRQFDIGVKLSRAYLREGEYEEAFAACERLQELPCISDEDTDQLSLSRVIASAAAASSQICTSHRRLSVSLVFLCFFSVL